MGSFWAATAFFFLVWLISFVSATAIGLGFKFSAEVGLLITLLVWGLIESVSGETSVGSSEEEISAKPPEPPKPGVDTYV